MFREGFFNLIGDRPIWNSQPQAHTEVLIPPWKLLSNPLIRYQLRRMKESVFYLCRSIFVCCYVSPLDYSKSYERILMRFFGGMGHRPRTNRLDFGSDPKPFPLFCLNYYPIMHFQWDSNSLLYARWQRYNANGIKQTSPWRFVLSECF